MKNILKHWSKRLFLPYIDSNDYSTELIAKIQQKTHNYSNHFKYTFSGFHQKVAKDISQDGSAKSVVT